jgi:pimeloyl-ACP methyl ester carboxylesterase
LYEQIAEWRDQRRVQRIGESVDIGGRTLNIHCVGEGNPVVVFESPGAGPGLLWKPLQEEIAKLTRACWYDRAGEGWSDPGPFPRTSAAIASDLHELLHRAHIPAPYVLVGASFGGLNARIYGARYPEEVAGMVLVESAHEDELKRAPKFFLAPSPPRYLWYPLHLAFQTAWRIGLVRITRSPRLDADATLRALEQQPKSIVSSALTGIVEPESYEQARAVVSLGSMPLIVLTGAKPMTFDDPEMARQAAEFQQVWITQMQAQLAQLSTHGRQIILQNSDHAITEHAPEAVISAVQDVLTAGRQPLR